MRALRNLRLIFLLIYAGVLWSGAILALIEAYWEHHAWVMGDWLINYAGGFVRRGLPGHLFIWLSRSTGLKPGVFVILTIASIYGVFLVWVVQILSQQPSISPFFISLAAPYLFMFPLWHWQGDYRKEIMLFALYAWLIQSVIREPEKVWFRTIQALSIFPILLLSHEGLMAWGAFLFLPLLAFHPPLSVWPLRNLRKRRLLFILITINLSVWFTTLWARGTTHKVHAIQDTLRETHYVIFHPSNAIVWLTKPLKKVIVEQCVRWRREILRWLGSLAVISISYLPLWPRLVYLWNKFAIRIIWILSASMTLVLTCIGRDWGRFVHIYSMMLFLSLLVVNRHITNVPGKQTLWIQPGVYGLVSIIYGTTWHWHGVQGFQGWHSPKMLGQLIAVYSHLAQKAILWLLLVWKIIQKHLY